MAYKKVKTVDILNDNKIKFTFNQVDGKYDGEIPFLMGTMLLIPEHFLR